MRILIIGIASLVLVALVHTKGLSSSLTLGEQKRIGSQLQKSHTNLADIYYAASGLNALGKSVHDVEAACKLASKEVDSSSAKSIFHYSEVAKICKCQAPVDLKQALTSLIDGDTEISTIALSQAIAAMSNLGYSIDVALIKRFVAAIKESDSPTSAAMSFYAASLLPKSAELKPVVDMVEDIMAQADEIDNTMLQFEGGLTVTSGVVRGIFSLAEQQGKALIKQEQVVKLASFFLNRKFVFSLKDIHSILVAVAALSNNKFQVPVVVTTYKTSAITKDTPTLKVRVTNLLDKAVPDVKVTAKSFTDAEGKVLFEKKAFSKGPDSDMITIETDAQIAMIKGSFAAHTYELDVAANKPARGLYKVAIGVDYKEGSQKFIGGGVFEVPCRVLAKVVISNVNIGVGDNAKASSVSKKSLTYPSQLESELTADHHQKIVMTFSLAEMDSGAALNAHQVFVRLTNEESGQEVFFVAEASSEGNYKFNLDVGATGKESFNNLSGKYKMSLIIGDATIQVPVNWPIGSLSLTFSGESKTTKRAQANTGPEPVIEHKFREPEKRPSKLVSTVFTGLVFVPLVIMLVVWAKIGANLSNFQMSPATVIFHVGLAGVFGLYYMFWVKYTMFHTLKLLVLVGGITFLGGNSMLAKMAADKYRH